MEMWGSWVAKGTGCWQVWKLKHARNRKIKPPPALFICTCCPPSQKQTAPAPHTPFPPPFLAHCESQFVTLPLTPSGISSLAHFDTWSPQHKQPGPALSGITWAMPPPAPAPPLQASAPWCTLINVQPSAVTLHPPTQNPAGCPSPPPCCRHQLPGAPRHLTPTT